MLFAKVDVSPKLMQHTEGNSVTANKIWNVSISIQQYHFCNLCYRNNLSCFTAHTATHCRRPTADTMSSSWELFKWSGTSIKYYSSFAIPVFMKKASSRISVYLKQMVAKTASSFPSAWPHPGPLPDFPLKEHLLYKTCTCKFFFCPVGM